MQGWEKGIDYVRMDGSTSAQNRKEWAEMFNDPENLKYIVNYCLFFDLQLSDYTEWRDVYELRAYWISATDDLPKPDTRDFF